jgi:hypothetical protein
LILEVGGIFLTALKQLMGNIQIVKPPNSGSLYFKYKKTISTLLMAVVNGKLPIHHVDVGSNGWVSEGLFICTTLF